MKQSLDFLVIGAQKCATTWIYNCLKQHPQLHLPAKKREVEYLGGKLYENRGADWYFSLLAGAKSDQKLGDVSVEYLFDSRSPQIIHQYAPHIKLVVSLRDPIDRAISAYYWYLRKGKIPNLNLELGLKLAVESESNSNRQKSTENLVYNDIIRRGFYDCQIKSYRQHFQLEQFLFVLYEEIQQQPLLVLQKIYNFLGVKPNYCPDKMQIKPKHNTYLLPMIYLERLAPRSQFMGKVMDGLNQLFYRWGISGQKPNLSPSLLHKLSAIYKPHIIDIERIIQLAPLEQQPISKDLLKIWTKKRSYLYE